MADSLASLLPRRKWSGSREVDGSEPHAGLYTYPNGWTVPHDPFDDDAGLHHDDDVVASLTTRHEITDDDPSWTLSVYRGGGAKLLFALLALAAFNTFLA